MVTPMHYFSTFGGKYLPEPANGMKQLVRGGAPDEEDEFIKLLWRRFPEFCKTIFSPIVNGVGLYHYFDSADLEAHGITYLQTVINQIAFANHVRRDKARDFAQDWTKANVERFFAMTKPPGARDILDEKDIDLYDHVYVDEALKEIWKGTETVTNEDVVAATTAQLSGRGNFHSDPEQWVQDQIHDPLAPANVVGVTKDLVFTPIDRNPSSQLHIRNPVPLSDRFDGLRDFLEMRAKQNIEDLEDFNVNQPPRRLRLITTSFGVVHETTTVTILGDRIKLETNTEIYPMNPILPQQPGRGSDQDIVEDSSIANVRRTQYIKRKGHNQQSKSQSQEASVPELSPVDDRLKRLMVPSKLSPGASNERIPPDGEHELDRRFSGYPGPSATQEQRRHDFSHSKALVPHFDMLKGPARTSLLNPGSQPLSGYLVSPQYTVGAHYPMPPGIQARAGYAMPLDYPVRYESQHSPEHPPTFGPMAQSVYCEPGPRRRELHEALVYPNDGTFQTQRGWNQSRVSSHESESQPASGLSTYNGPIETSPRRRLQKLSPSDMDYGDFSRDLYVGDIPGNVNLNSLMEFFQILPGCQISDPALSGRRPGDALGPASWWYFYLRFPSADLAEEAKAMLMHTPCPLLSNGRQWLTVRNRNVRTEKRYQASSSRADARTQQGLQIQLQQAEHQAVFDSSSESRGVHQQQISQNVDRKAGSVQSIEPSKENSPPDPVTISSPTVTRQPVPSKQRQQRPVPDEEPKRRKTTKRQKDKHRAEVSVSSTDPGTSKATLPATVGPAKILTPVTNAASAENNPSEPLHKHRQNFRLSMPSTESGTNIPPGLVKDNTQTPSQPVPGKMPRRSSLYEILQDVQSSKTSKLEPVIKQAKGKSQVEGDKQGDPKQDVKESKSSKSDPDMKEFQETIQKGRDKLRIQQDVEESQVSKPEPETKESKETLRTEGDKSRTSKNDTKTSKASKPAPEVKTSVEKSQVKGDNSQKVQERDVKKSKAPKHKPRIKGSKAPPQPQEHRREVKTQPAGEFGLQVDVFAAGFNTITEAPTPSSSKNAMEPVHSQPADSAGDPSTQAPQVLGAAIVGPTTIAPAEKAIAKPKAQKENSSSQIAADTPKQRGSTQLSRKPVGIVPPAVPDVRKLNKLLMEEQRAQQGDTAAKKAKMTAEDTAGGEVKQSAKPPKKSQQAPRQSKPASRLGLQHGIEDSGSSRQTVALESQPPTTLDPEQSAASTPKQIGIADWPGKGSSIYQTPPSVGPRPPPLNTDLSAHRDDNSAYNTANSAFATPNLFSQLQEVSDKNESRDIPDQAKAFNARSPTPEFATPPEHSPEARPTSSITSRPHDHGSQGIVESPSPLQRRTLRQLKEDTESHIDTIPSPPNESQVSRDMITLARAKSPPDEATDRLSDSADLSSETLKGDSVAADDDSDQHVERDGKQGPLEADKASREATKRMKKNQKKKEKKAKGKEQREAEKQRQHPNPKPEDVASSSTDFWTPNTTSQSETPYAGLTPKLTDPFTESEAPEEAETRIPNIDGAADSKQTYKYPALSFSQMADGYLDAFDNADPEGWSPISRSDKEKLVGSFGVSYNQSKSRRRDIFNNWNDFQTVILNCCREANTDPSQLMEVMYTEEQQEVEKGFASAEDLRELRAEIDAYNTEPKGFKYTVDDDNDLGFADRFALRLCLSYLKSPEALLPNTPEEYLTPSATDNIRRNIDDPIARSAWLKSDEALPPRTRGDSPIPSGAENVRRNITDPKARLAFYAEQQQNEASAPAQAANFAHSPLDFMASLIGDPSSRQAFLAKHKDDHNVPQSLDFPIPSPSQLLPPSVATAGPSTENVESENKTAQSEKGRLSETKEPKTPPSNPFPNDPTPELSPLSIKLFADLSQPADSTTSKPIPSKIIDNVIHILNPASPEEYMPATYHSTKDFAGNHYRINPADEIRFSPLDGSVLSVHRDGKYAYRCVPACKRDAAFKKELEQELPGTGGYFWDRLETLMTLRQWGDGKVDGAHLKEKIQPKVMAMRRELERAHLRNVEQEQLREMEQARLYREEIEVRQRNNRMRERWAREWKAKKRAAQVKEGLEELLGRRERDFWERKGSEYKPFDIFGEEEEEEEEGGSGYRPWISEEDEEARLQGKVVEVDENGVGRLETTETEKVGKGLQAWLEARRRGRPVGEMRRGNVERVREEMEKERSLSVE